MQNFKTIQITPQFDRIEFLQSFDPGSSTYVVSDLHTKLDIQKILFERFDFLAEDAVLRASELWQRLLLRARPEMQLVSQNLIQPVLSEWLEAQKIEWASGAGASQSLLTAIHQFLPIYMSEDGPALFKDWLTQNPNALMRMGQWFFLGLEAWNYLLSKNLALVSWVPAILSQIADLPSWPRHLIFDLESNLTGTESELIRRLSEQTQTLLLAPTEEWRRQYSKVLWPYSVLLGEAIEQKDLIEIDLTGIETRRFTTRMTEGKDAVGQVRAWLEAGVPIEKIAILAPDIEEYWPLIASYFEVEGIPVKKSKVAPLHSFVEVSAWLARLRVESKNLESADLELAIYNSRRRHEMAFDEFRTLFKKVYDFDDLKRDQDLYKDFSSEVTERSRLSRDAFITWALRRWHLNDPVDNLHLIVSHLLNETPPSIEMSVRSWVRYLEAVAAKTEKNVEPANAHGVAFMKTDSGFYQKWSHVYFLGLSESGVRGQDSSMLTLADIVQIGRDLGFYLDHPDKPKVECITHWISANPHRQSVLAFAATQFSGEPEAPALFWLSRALAAHQDIEAFTSPHLTRWDEVQGSIESYGAEELRRAVDEDLGRVTSLDLKIEKLPSLSASQIERFLQCPFKFSADKLLKLVDPAEVDLDLDHRTRGNMLHAIFETLLEEPLNLNRSEEELAELVEKLRQQEKITFGDSRLWPAYKARFVALAQRFQDFEKEWRQKYPHTKTIGREFAFEVGYRIAEGEFCPKDVGDFNFRGRIDRVDESTTGGELILLDYKSSGSGLRNYGSWLKNTQLQLALYSMIVESGFTKLGSNRKVAGAFYYVAKDFTREKGMQVEGLGVGVLPPPSKGNKIVPAKQAELYGEVRKLIQEVAETIRSGRMHVKPQKPQDCPSCRWRKLCRAPHLN